MNIVLIGGPLSGKGTQAKLISKEYGLCHISTGELFREMIETNSKYKDLISEYMNKGSLVPDDITIKVLKEKLSTIDLEKGVLLDGFPRTLNQSQKLDNIFKIDQTIFLDIPMQVALERVETRFVCESCNKNVRTNNKNNPCIYCGGKLTKRKDDTTTTAMERFKEFMLVTQPVIEFYTGQKKLFKVDATKSIEEIFNEIKVRLNTLW